MLFDSSRGGDEGPSGPWCTICNGLISDDEKPERITFAHDPHGHKGFTGLYHQRCARPFASFARILNMKP